jgi:hypothetical protein
MWPAKAGKLAHFSTRNAQMAVTHANSKHYDKMSKAVDNDSHLGASAMAPKTPVYGRNGGKADRNMAPSPKGGKSGC